MPKGVGWSAARIADTHSPQSGIRGIPQEMRAMNSRRVEDAVKNLWLEIVEKGREVSTSEMDEEMLKLLTSGGYVKIRNRTVKLTDRGEKLGRRLVRLHRLAERLLLDVLGMEEKVYESASCSVEHAITEELEEAICTLLGHPKICPHGKDIPPGVCCMRRKNVLTKIVYSLPELSPGDEGRICYLASNRKTLVSRMLNMGIVPGSHIKVLMKTPSYLIQVGNTQVALDENVARAIYVIKSRREGQAADNEL